MVAIHNNLSANADLIQDNGDGTVDNSAATPDASSIAAVANAAAPLPPTGIASSSFDGVKSGPVGSVLNTAPPALGGGQTAPVSLADAIGRMKNLQNADPLRSALTLSAEDGSAPAVPQQRAAVGASGAPAASDTPAASNAPAASSAPAASNTPATPSAASGQTAASTTVDMDQLTNNVDVSRADQDLSTAANTVESAAAETTRKTQGCKKVDDFTGEKGLASRIQKMGVPKDQANTLARMLNPINNGSDVNQNPADQRVVALAIAAYDKLNANGNTEAAKTIVDDLTALAKSNKDSTKNQAGSQAYYKALNTLGNYALDATSSSAAASLTSPTAAARIVPYPTIVD